MAEENLNLLQKLAKIRALSDVAKKSKKGYNYTYTDVTEILANVTAGMKKYGVSLMPQIVPGTSVIQQNVTINTKFDKTGKTYDQKTTEMLYTGEMNFTWVNDDNPNERIDIPWFVTGSMPDPSQAVGSSLSYAMRQFLTSYFQIAQADSDIDAYRSKQKAAEVSEDVAIATGIIEQFDVLLRTYLADHPDKAEETKKFISKYAKNANYKAIKEPALASKLVEDFKNTYMKEEG